MSAASSKKLEEKYNKILLDVKKRPHNRTCFDCNARGTNYANLNVNTFVCTTCSGIHREMQHKVKSIGMSTFTIDEIKALDAGGNARAHAVWLANMPPGTQRPQEGNAQQIRAHMKAVYELKRYYSEAAAAAPPPQPAAAAAAPPARAAPSAPPAFSTNFAAFGAPPAAGGGGGAAAPPPATPAAPAAAAPPPEPSMMDLLGDVMSAPAPPPPAAAAGGLDAAFAAPAMVPPRRPRRRCAPSRGRPGRIWRLWSFWHGRLDGNSAAADDGAARRHGESGVLASHADEPACRRPAANGSAAAHDGRWSHGANGHAAAASRYRCRRRSSGGCRDGRRRADGTHGDEPPRCRPLLV